MRYEHLLGLDFVHGERDCYTMLRSYFSDNHGIELDNFDREDGWWDGDENLYMDNYSSQGFEVIDVHPTDYNVSDVFLIAVRSRVPNHAAIHLGEGYILHHFYNRRSSRELYKGIWRNNTLAVLRHRDLKHIEQEKTEIDFADILSPHMKAKVNRATEA